MAKLRLALAFLATLNWSVCASAQATQETTVPIVVTDGTSFLRSLQPSDLKAKERGQDVEILSVTWEQDAPIYYAVLLEASRALPTSGYYRGFHYPQQDVMYEQVRVAYELSRAMREQDRFAVASFGRKLEVLLEFTGRLDLIEETLTNYLNRPIFASPDSSTFDAVTQAIENVRPKATGKRIVLIVLGTGQNTFSRATLGETLQLARMAGIQIVFIQVGWQAIEEQANNAQRCGDRGHSELQCGLASVFGDSAFYWVQAYAAFSGVARASGGYAASLRFVGAAREYAEMVGLWAESTQFLTYRAPVLKADGKLHKLEIVLITAVEDAGGKAIKAAVHSIDGRRLPKEKKR